jgi:prepilin signal peptidase PulO-like enzyme (type II secretory pathway)
MVKMKGTLKTAIPFGPYLVFGAILYLLADTDLSLWYTRLLFPNQL